MIDDPQRSSSEGPADNRPPPMPHRKDPGPPSVEAVVQDIDRAAELAKQNAEFVRGVKQHVDTTLEMVEKDLVPPSQAKSMPPPPPKKEEATGPLGTTDGHGQPRRRSSTRKDNFQTTTARQDNSLSNSPAVYMNTLLGIILAVAFLGGYALSAEAIQAITVILSGAFLVIPTAFGYVIRQINIARGNP